jgi:hypothetical protein
VVYPIAFSAVAIVGASSGMPTVAPAWPTVVNPVRIGSSPVMKFGAPGGAAGLGIVVGETHALAGESVEVRRHRVHEALVIGPDILPADVVAHDHDNVGLLVLCVGLGHQHRQCRDCRTDYERSCRRK